MESTASEAGAQGGEMLSLIGRRLRALRKSQNLSQREVADAIGLPQSNLSRIENGKQRLNLTVLSRMLAIYQNNPAAFDNNMNIMRSGAVLRIPENSAVASISSAWRWRFSCRIRHSTQAVIPAVPSGVSAVSMVPPSDELT